MIIKRKSPITGKVNEMHLPISATDILMAGSGGMYIHTICPHLTVEEVVFYTTGKTVEEQQAENEDV